MLKSLKDISWQVTEPEYRADPALSYSTLATFDRVGFNGLDTLFERKESPSLTFGSAVDTLITDGEDAFNAQFYVADIPAIADSIQGIVRQLFSLYKEECQTLQSISFEKAFPVIESMNYQPRWRPETRYKDIIEKGAKLYNMLFLSQNKSILTAETYERVQACVVALTQSDATKFYFAANNPFDGIERLYQLKFKVNLRGMDFRCMADLIVVNHNDKTIQPVDLKTSSHKEWDFFYSFIEWKYQIQARLYYRIIEAVIKEDDYFKDFTLLPYKFIVVNNQTLDPTPLVWDCPFTKAYGLLKFGKNDHIEMKDPFNIASDLLFYMKNQTRVPIGINVQGSNNLKDYLDNI